MKKTVVAISFKSIIKNVEKNARAEAQGVSDPLLVLSLNGVIDHFCYVRCFGDP